MTNMKYKEIINGLADIADRNARFGSLDRHDWAAIDAAISRLQSLQWRPIKEAPRDGARLLLMTPWGIVIGRWRNEAPASDCARAMIYAGWESEGGETWPAHNMGDEGDTEQHGMPTHFIPLSAFNQEEE